MVRATQREGVLGVVERVEAEARGAVQDGLVDALGDMRSVLRDRYGPKTRLKLITAPRGLFGRRLGVFGSRDGSGTGDIVGSATSGLLQAIEDRALWNRFGL